MPQRYLDDFKLGEVFKSKAQTLSDKHFSLFAQLTGDAHPSGKGWDGPLAHGLLLLGLCAIGAAPISEDLTDSMIAMLGNDVRYKRPAFSEDTITPQFLVLAIEPKDERRGILRLGIELYNQRSELILEGTHIIMLRRRMTVTRAESFNSGGRQCL